MFCIQLKAMKNVAIRKLLYLWVNYIWISSIDTGCQNLQKWECVSMLNLWNVILSSSSPVNKCFMQNKLDMADLARFSSKVHKLKWLKDSFKNLLT